MFWIIIIKILLVTIGVCSVGILFLLALLNQWIWNNIIVGNVLSCAIPITSYWICLGLSIIGSFSLGGLLWNIWKK